MPSSAEGDINMHELCFGRERVRYSSIRFITRGRDKAARLKPSGSRHIRLRLLFS